MQEGDYLLINGNSVRIKRASDRFVTLDTGKTLSREEAGLYKCSRSGEEPRQNEGAEGGYILSLI
jgi:hypothetical protein